MLKNTVTGSFLANLLPSFAKTFLENATQEEVNKAEQEAAVIHQQLNGLGESGRTGVPVEGTPAGAGTPNPAVSAATTVDMAGQLTAMTTRATDAEAKVTTLTGQLTTAQQDRDQYKAWYDKQAGKGTALPGADATNRGAAAQEPTLSEASAQAMAHFKQRRAMA